MNVLIITIIYGIIFLLAFVSFLFLFILLRRIIINQLQRTFQKKYKQIEIDILEAISSPNPEACLKIARKYREQPNVLIKVLMDYADIIKGKEREKLKIIFNYTLKEKCLKALNSAWTAKKLKALRLLIIFSDPSDIKKVIKFLHDKPILRLTVINALSRIQETETPSYILQALEEDAHPNLLGYMHALYMMGNKIVKPLKRYLKNPLPVEKLGMLIELVGAIPLHPLYEDIIAFSEHPDKEIRVKVARALGNMQRLESIEILKRLSNDNSWEVKAQAIKSLGKMKSIDALKIISRGLFSPFWHVRYNAGYALANLGAEGIKQLKRVAKQKKDRYAADMASMVLDNIIYSKG